MRYYVLKTAAAMLAKTDEGFVPASETQPPTLFVCKTTAQAVASEQTEKSVVVEIEIIEKKRKSFSAEKLFARYKTYEGPSGSVDEWRAQAEIMAAKIGSDIDALSILGLSKMPDTLEELKKVRKKLMRTAHPDRGGDADAASKINGAYELIEKLVIIKTRPKEINSNIIRPMLAEPIDDVNDLVFPLFASPKLDGIRCLKLDGRVLSRKFKPIPNLFTNDWLFENVPDGLDGELMVVGRTFNEIQSDIMSVDGNPDFEYWVFDHVADSLDEPFEKRFERLSEKVKGLNPKRVKLVPHIIIKNVRELLDFEQKCLDEGHEGVMVRSLNSPYKCGRSSLKQGYLLKLKRFSDSEAEVLGFEELMHNNNALETDELGMSKRSSSKAGKVGANSLGRFRVRDIHTGAEFKLGTGEGLTQKLRQEIWDNQAKFFGKIVKYKYQKSGQKDLPRIPIWLGFRDERDMS